MKAEVSIPAALATATVVYAIQGRGMAPLVDVRGNATPGDEVIESVRKQNAWLAAATVGGISLIARDPLIFIVGGSMVIVLDWLTRVNNWTSPVSNKVDRATGVAPPAEPVSPDVDQVNADYLSAVS